MFHLLLNTLTGLLRSFPRLQLILELHDFNLHGEIQSTIVVYCHVQSEVCGICKVPLSLPHSQHYYFHPFLFPCYDSQTTLF